MKAFLMYRDSDFDMQQKLPANEQALIQDLALDTLFAAMARGDKLLFEVAKKAVLTGLTNPDGIVYRQRILQDCLQNASIIREIYAILAESIEGRKKYYYSFFSKYPAAILHQAIEQLELFFDTLKKMRTIADQYADHFVSEGFTVFFAMLRRELDDEYLSRIEEYLKELTFRDGVLISAELGKGNKGSNYVLRKNSEEGKHGWRQRFFGMKTPVYVVHIHARDESGARALAELRDRGINLVADVLARSTDHIRSFFTILRTELAFYIGCMNLQEQLVNMGAPISFPLPLNLGEPGHSFQGLYDVCLALSLKQRIVGNKGKPDNKKLVIITGANQGGKSTFLRSIGLAQLMLQCGMFVPAEALSASVCSGLFTHYKREEDAAMNSGKLDEELSRMSDIADHITANSLILFNESFAATNEREGAEIARQIVSALMEKQIKIFFVTHQYEFAHGFYEKKSEDIIFLRAERQNDGERTFKIVEGEPLQTSYGEDLYNKIFGTA
ncbi:MAG: hypothetical protein ABFC84_08175 [Veillonellales bacterium]